jgi:hypothetical protein
MQFLEDEGAVPTPEEDVTREQVIRKLKKVINRGRGFRDEKFRYSAVCFACA